MTQKNHFHQLMARLLVRFRIIKRVPVSLGEINPLINKSLPLTVDVAIPGGMGELSILEVTLSIVDHKSYLSAELLCNFSVNVKQSIIYNTHLQLSLRVNPEYSEKNKSIGLSQVKVIGLNVISDQYSLIKDPGSLINRLVPGTLKSMLNITLSSTKAILENKAVNGIVKYLSLYSTGSSQRIVDYHREDIESKIIQAAESDEMKYRLDEGIFEQKLFSEYGKQITIEDGKIFFIFHT